MQQTRLAKLIGAFLLLSLTTGPLAGCGRAGPRTPVVLPSGMHLVAQMRYDGGFVPMEWTLIQAPRLAVYSDGTAIADAHRVLTLTLDDARGLVASLRDDLNGLSGTVEAAGSDRVADASTAVIEVIEADGSLRSVRAYALDIVSGYPARLVSAGTAMTQLAERVNRDGAPYSSSRVRLVSANREATGVVPAWPVGVPVPAPAEPDGVRRSTLDGDAAAAAVRAWPTDVTQGGVWPVARTPDGTVVGVGWRYLLPDEP